MLFRSEQISSSGNDGKYTQTTKDTIRLSEPWYAADITTYTAEEAYEQVLGYAGACDNRDKLDQMIIDDVRNRTASYTARGNKSGYINTPNDTQLPGEDLPCPFIPISMSTIYDTVDTDGDGIPDSWEKTMDLDPNDPSDALLTNSVGYTNLEIYLYSLVRSITNNQTNEIGRAHV